MSIDVACHLNVVVADLSSPHLERALDGLAALGYSSVVLPPIDPATAPLEQLGSTFRRCGIIPITIAGQAGGADVSSDDAQIRLRGEDSLRRMVDATVALGGDQMNGVPYGPFGHSTEPCGPGVFERTAVHVGAVADYAHEEGVAMTFEVLNRYETSMINTASQARAFVRASGSFHLGIHLDSFHMAVEETDMLDAVSETTPVLGYLELGQSGRGPLSRGAVDPSAVVTAALSAGYRGRVGVEAFSRSILSTAAGDALAIWRETYDDGLKLAAEAVGIIRAAESAFTAQS